MIDPPGPQPPPEAHEPRGVEVARSELRDQEAQRVLGLLTPGELPSRARRWSADGLDHPHLAALAGADTDTDTERTRLLREAAAALGLTFATVRDAREHHARAVIRSMTASSASGVAQAFSDGVTDAFEESVRQRLTRLFRPGS